MGNIVDFNKYKEKRGKGVKFREGSNLHLITEDPYETYINMLKLVYSSMPVSDINLYMDCENRKSVVFRDTTGKILNHTIIANNTQEEFEKEDLIISMIISWSPSQLIVRNINRLDETLAKVIITIFENILVLED